MPLADGGSTVRGSAGWLVSWSGRRSLPCARASWIASLCRSDRSSVSSCGMAPSIWVLGWQTDKPTLGCERRFRCALRAPNHVRLPLCRGSGFMLPHSARPYRSRLANSTHPSVKPFSTSLRISAESVGSLTTRAIVIAPISVEAATRARRFSRPCPGTWPPGR